MVKQRKYGFRPALTIFIPSLMKLATYKDGSRDGQLIVVSRDLTTAHYATGTADRLQQVLDDWNFMSPQLQDLSDALNQSGHSRARHAFPFDAARCMAPLPRAYQWVAGPAFVEPAELRRTAAGTDRPASLTTHPLMRQGASDHFLGPQDPITVPSEDAAAAWGLDFEAGLAVVTADVPLGASAAQALDSVRLLMLVNDVSLRHLLREELATGLGGVQGKPGAAFSPVAVTLDELTFGGDSAWQDGRVQLNLQSSWNGRKACLVDAGRQMAFGFGELIAHTCRTRPLRAGSVIGSGAVINQGTQQGYSCIAEKQARETLENGEPTTPYMAVGDTLKIEAKGKNGLSLFGAIVQTVALSASA